MTYIRETIYSIPELKECHNFADGRVYGIVGSRIEGETFTDRAVCLQRFGKEGIFGAAFGDSRVCRRDVVGWVSYDCATPWDGFEVVDMFYASSEVGAHNGLKTEKRRN